MVLVSHDFGVNVYCCYPINTNLSGLKNICAPYLIYVIKN